MPTLRAANTWIDLLDKKHMGNWVAMPYSENESRLDMRGGMIYLEDAQLRYARPARDPTVRIVARKISGTNPHVHLRTSIDGGCKYVAAFNGKNDFPIGRIDNGQSREIKRGASEKTFEDFFEFTVSVVGDKITISADGQEVPQAQDVLYDFGRLQIGTSKGASLIKEVRVQVQDLDWEPGVRGKK